MGGLIKISKLEMISHVVSGPGVNDQRSAGCGGLEGCHWTFQKVRLVDLWTPKLFELLQPATQHSLHAFVHLTANHRLLQYILWIFKRINGFVVIQDQIMDQVMINSMGVCIWGHCEYMVLLIETYYSDRLNSFIKTYILVSLLLLTRLLSGTWGNTKSAGVRRILHGPLVIFLCWYCFLKW